MSVIRYMVVPYKCTNAHAKSTLRETLNYHSTKFWLHRTVRYWKCCICWFDIRWTYILRSSYIIESTNTALAIQYRIDLHRTVRYCKRCICWFDIRWTSYCNDFHHTVLRVLQVRTMKTQSYKDAIQYGQSMFVFNCFQFIWPVCFKE